MERLAVASVERVGADGRPFQLALLDYLRLGVGASSAQPSKSQLHFAKTHLQKVSSLPVSERTLVVSRAASSLYSPAGAVDWEEKRCEETAGPLDEALTRFLRLSFGGSALYDSRLILLIAGEKEDSERIALKLSDLNQSFAWPSAVSYATMAEARERDEAKALQLRSQAVLLTGSADQKDLESRVAHSPTSLLHSAQPPKPALKRSVGKACLLLPTQAASGFQHKVGTGSGAVLSVMVGADGVQPLSGQRESVGRATAAASLVPPVYIPGPIGAAKARALADSPTSRASLPNGPAESAKERALAGPDLSNLTQIRQALSKARSETPLRDFMRRLPAGLSPQERHARVRAFLVHCMSGSAASANSHSPSAAQPGPPHKTPDKRKAAETPGTPAEGRVQTRPVRPPTPKRLRPSNAAAPLTASSSPLPSQASDAPLDLSNKENRK